MNEISIHWPNSIWIVLLNAVSGTEDQFLQICIWQLPDLCEPAKGFF